LAGKKKGTIKEVSNNGVKGFDANQKNRLTVCATKNKGGGSSKGKKKKSERKSCKKGVAIP